MELVFQAHRQPVKRANWGLVGSEIRIKLLGLLNSSVKEDLQQAIRLWLLSAVAMDAG